MISVCIPTYNGAKYIKEQLTSILDELSENDEVIISDDGSTDNTLDIVLQLNDPRIKFFNHCPKPIESFNNPTEKLLKQVSLNVQNALINANGDFIYLADQDDIWLKGRVSKTLKLLNKNEPILVINDCNIIDENYEVTESSYFNYVSPSHSLLRTIFKSSFHGCCMCFNRKLLQKAFPFPEYSLGHDLWLGLTAIKYGDVIFVQESLISYRRHSNTVTLTGEKSKNTLRFKLYYRYKLICEYMKLRDKL